MDELERWMEDFLHKPRVKLNELWSNRHHSRRLELRYGGLTRETFFVRLPSLWHSLKAKSHPDILKYDCKPYRWASKTFDRICAADTKKSPLVTVTNVMSEEKYCDSIWGVITSFLTYWKMNSNKRNACVSGASMPARWLGHNHTLYCLYKMEIRCASSFFMQFKKCVSRGK